MLDPVTELPPEYRDRQEPTATLRKGAIFGLVTAARALYEKGDPGNAAATYREALQYDPAAPLARQGFISAAWEDANRRADAGDLDRAVRRLREMAEFKPTNPNYPIRLLRLERWRAALPRLPAVLAGTARPANPAEAAALADLCQLPFQKQYAAAVRLFEEAFAADPALVSDLSDKNRYNAACAATLAGCGLGVNAPAGSGEQAKLRAKAFVWLRAELAVRRQQAGSSATERASAAAALTHWQRDSDLAWVRPGFRRIGLPADERARWDAFWADVAAVLSEARKPAPPRELAPPPRAGR